MGKSKIEWTDYTWNPVTGCTPVSEGCENCYAKQFAKRLAGRHGYPKDDPFRVTLHPERLEEPLRWRKPRRVFVCSMSDLFHPDVPGKFINEVWMVMRNASQHLFLVLTKRPERMLAWTDAAAMAKAWPIDEIWPDNVWIGVTAENQQTADERIPILLQIPAAVRFVSVEPMLSAVNLTQITIDEARYVNALTGEHWLRDGFDKELEPLQRIDWIICGGETGPGARPCHPDWIRSLRDQCQESGVPFFFKNWGQWFPREQWEYNPELVLPDDEYAYVCVLRSLRRLLSNASCWSEESRSPAGRARVERDAECLHRGRLRGGGGLMFKTIITAIAVAIIALLAWYAVKKDRESQPFVPDGVRLVCGRCGYKATGPTDTLACPRCGNYLDISAM